MVGIHNLTYLAVDLFILLPFVIKINDPRLRLRKNLRSIAISTSVVLVIFIIWDFFAVQAGVWGFNPHYIIGIDLAGVPIEEILFFVAVPVTSVLVWEATGFWEGRQ